MLGFESVDMNAPKREKQTAIDTPNGSRILISILNWNSLDDTEKCLESITSAGVDEWEIVVIDNGSAVDPTFRFAKLFPSVECISLSTNRGFTGGQNFGMQLAIDRGYEAVFLLNNDCEISSDAIRELIKVLRADPLSAAISPLIYCAEDRTKPQIVAAWFDWANHCSVRPSTPSAKKPDAMPVAVAGTALLLRCKALEQIGLLDDRYFAYYEDNDLSARIAKAGWTALYCQTASAWHSSRKVAEYSDMALYLSARNAWLFWRTNTPSQFRKGMFIHLLAQSLNEITLLKKAGAEHKTAAVVAGFWDAQRNRFGVPPSIRYSPVCVRFFMYHAPYFLYQILSKPSTSARFPLKKKS